MTKRVEDNADDNPFEISAVEFPADQYLALLSPHRRVQIAGVTSSLKRWVGYGRYSTDNQDPDSLDRQKRNIKPLYQGPNDVLVVYLTDAGRSGTTTHGRPGLARLMTMVRNHECDAVAIESVDRLSRNVGQLMQMFEEMQQCGVELHDAKYGKLDWMHVYLLGMMAQLGRDRLLDLLKDGAKEKIRKGRIFSGPIFGYINHPQHGSKLRIVDEERRGLIRWIFEQIAAGATCYQVAKDLCAKYPSPPPGSRPRGSKGYKPPFDEAWVRRTIKNALYMGINVWKRGKTIHDFLTRKVVGKKINALLDQMMIDIKHLSIVSHDLWSRANAALDERSLSATNGGGNKRAGPFSGRLFCVCGAPMLRFGPADRRDVRCQARSYRGALKCDAFTAIPLEWTESVLLDRLFQEIDGSAQNARFRTHIAAIVAEEKADATRRLAQTKTDLARAERRRERLFEEHEIVGCSKEWLKSNREQVEAKITDGRAKVLQGVDTSALDRILAEFTEFDNAIEVIRGRLPFEVDSAEDQVFLDAVYRVVRRVRIAPTDTPGLMQFTLHLRCAEQDVFTKEMSGRDGNEQLFLPLGDLYNESEDFVVEFTASLEKSRVNKATAAAQKRAAEREAIAASGTLDMSDRTWRIVKPLIQAVDVGTGERQVEPRRAFDGLFFALKVPHVDLETQLPARYGLSKAVSSYLRRAARCGALDAVLEALRRDAPRALDGCDLTMLFTSRFQRANAVAEKRRSLKAYTSADVQRLLDVADAESDAPTRVRLLAVAARIDGKTNKEVAAKYGLTATYISELVVRFLGQDIEGLRGIKRRGRRSQFTPEIIEDLRTFVAKGFDPAAPHQPLTRARVQRWLQEKNIKISIEPLARLLNANGIVISEAVAEARLARAA